MTPVLSRKLDGPVDLGAVAGDDGWSFARDGVGVAGRGLWRRVTPEEAVEVLRDLGDRVVAIGARPFAPDKPWDLAIPSYQVRVEADGTVWETRIGDDPVPPARVDEHVGTCPSSVRLEDVDDPRTWCAMVARATEMIRAGAIDKVVLAREVLAIGDRPFSPAVLGRRLAAQFAGCFVFGVDGLVGASPELLVERDHTTVRSQPMAGTTRRSADPATDQALQQALLDSPTYRQEHQLTIDMVHDTLLSFTSYLDYQPEPSIVTLANVAHLASRVEGELSSPSASVLELQEALHPTPAVSGRPRDRAIAVIDELEARDRGRYAGTVGWVDGQGNGTWAVTIRCAQIDPADPRRARLHAGCGLVADSEPDNELAESEAKLRAIRSVLED